jgi:hypothetical protein
MIRYLFYLFSLVPFVNSQPVAQQCLLTLPQNPLSAVGLSTPFILQGLDPMKPCTMANTMTSTFVEAIIFNPDTNNLYVYNPLVVDNNMTPLLHPVQPQIPNNAIIALFFGTNGISLTLQPQLVIQQSKCVNGISMTDIFGQFAHCNAIAFYEAINNALKNGNQLVPHPPPLGTAIDGLPCPTTRSFFIVDQDPSDNLVTTYLLDPITNNIMQDTPANRLQFPNAIILKNGSDNRLLTILNIALECTSYMVPSLTDPQGLLQSSSLPTNEIHAMIHQMNPIAFIPKGDPMVRIVTNNGPIPSLVKINAYRHGVNQPQITNLVQASTSFFCVHMIEELPRLQNNKALFITQPSPDPAAANNLFTFLANRFSQSYMNLKCDVILDVINPVNLVMANDIVVDATFVIVDKIILDAPDPYNLQEPTTVPPTTVPPTTVPPITVPPTTVPPTTSVISNINNVTSSQYTGLIYGLVFGAVGLAIMCYYLYYRYCKNQNQNIKQDMIPILREDVETGNNSPRTPKRITIVNMPKINKTNKV